MFEEMKTSIVKVKNFFLRFFKPKQKTPTINVNITITIGDINRFSA